MVQSMAVETFGVVDVEEPKYEVVFKRDGGPINYEIRRYGKRCGSLHFIYMFLDHIPMLFPHPGLPLRQRWRISPPSQRVETTRS